MLLAGCRVRQEEVVWLKLQAGRDSCYLLLLLVPDWLLPLVLVGGVGWLGGAAGRWDGWEQGLQVRGVGKRRAARQEGAGRAPA